jgi:hypothetical protein
MKCSVPAGKGAAVEKVIVTRYNADIRSYDEFARNSPFAQAQ